MAVAWPPIDTMTATINSLSGFAPAIPSRTEISGIFTSRFQISLDRFEGLVQGELHAVLNQNRVIFRLDVRSPRMARPALDAKRVDHGRSSYESRRPRATLRQSDSRNRSCDERAGVMSTRVAKPAKAAPVLAITRYGARRRQALSALLGMDGLHELAAAQADGLRRSAFLADGVPQLSE